MMIKCEYIRWQQPGFYKLCKQNVWFFELKDVMDKDNLDKMSDLLLYFRQFRFLINFIQLTFSFYSLFEMWVLTVDN